MLLRQYGLLFETKRLPFWLTFLTLAALPCSITAMNWGLGIAAVSLLVLRFSGRDRFYVPPLLAPIGALFLWTLASILASGHAAQGWEGIRKFYLFSALFLTAGTVRSRADARWLVWGLTATTTLSAAWSLVQFYRKYEAAQAVHADFRLSYTAGERITGFMSHWMTLSGEEMIVLLLIAGLALFGGAQRLRVPLAVCGAAIAISLAAGYTRSMWMGTALGAGFLLWRRYRRWLLVLPVTAALVLLVNPAGIGSRLQSAWRPAGDVDSNRFRVICRRTAVAMVRAHPWFGVGPGQVRPQFLSYIPADIERPLPPGAYIHMHNTYLQFASERGLPALAALLWLLGKIVWDLMRMLRRDPDNWVLRSAMAATFAVLAAGWYEHNLGNGEVLPLFLAVVGCAYACANARCDIKLTP